MASIGGWGYVTLWIVFQLACAAKVRVVQVGAALGFVVGYEVLQIALYKQMMGGHVDLVLLVQHMHCCSSFGA